MIIVNFKTYESGTGENAVKMAKICEEVSKKTKVKIIVAVQAVDIEKISKSVSIPVYAQHVDAINYGSNTGKVLAETVKEAGASGSLLNHSENTIMLEEIKAGIEKLRKLGMTSIVCTKSPSESAIVAKFDPDYIAVEPPELIGTLKSVSKMNPKIVSDTVAKVQKVKNIPVLCGAGIANGEDVSKSLELGTKGVLVAAAIMKAADPKKALMDLAGGLHV